MIRAYGYQSIDYVVFKYPLRKKLKFDVIGFLILTFTSSDTKPSPQQDRFECKVELARLKQVSEVIVYEITIIDLDRSY